MSCLTIHQNHEWIPNTEGWLWILSPKIDTKDFSIFLSDKVINVPYELDRRGVWYYVKDNYFKNHCSIFHPQHSKSGGETSFISHVKLYSKSYPDYYLALINDKDHTKYKFVDSKEYQAEEVWFQNGKSTNITEIFAQAKKIQEEAKKNAFIKEQNYDYTNYVSQASNGNTTIVLPLLGALFGLVFIIYVLLHIPNHKNNFSR